MLATSIAKTLNEISNLPLINDVEPIGVEMKTILVGRQNDEYLNDLLTKSLKLHKEILSTEMTKTELVNKICDEELVEIENLSKMLCERVELKRKRLLEEVIDAPVQLSLNRNTLNDVNHEINKLIED